MNIAKILTVSLLFFSIEAKVILTNGVIISKEKVNQIYDALKVLKQQQKNFLIYDLYLSSLTQDQHSLIQSSLTIKKIFSQGRTTLHGEPHETVETLKQQEEENVKLAISLNLCDREKKIDKETAEIIRCSVSVSAKYKSLIPWVELKSPISWKTYFTKSYWRE